MGLGSIGTLLFAALVICWVAAVLSALIDNIPFVAVAIPVVAQMIGSFNVDAEVLWWALSLGACLGGNGTPIGASANVTTIGLAERDGTRITFGQFTRFGSVVTFFTLLISSAWLAVYVYAGQWTAFWLSLFAALVAGTYRFAKRSRMAEAPA
jgi:Na+/H+ antiporter NhaD/arsenite permease-like protein